MLLPNSSMSLRRRMLNLRRKESAILVLLMFPLICFTWRLFHEGGGSQAVGRRWVSTYKQFVELPHVKRRNIPQNNTLFTSPLVFQARQQRWMNVCSKSPNLKGTVHGVFPHATGVLYCFVPKAGCTFWKQVFNYAYANQQAREKFPTPWDFPRLFVHNNKMRRGRYFDEKNDTKNYPMRVVVARDPFSRMISTYLDKFYLPDFWMMMGMRLKRKDVYSIDFSASNFLSQHFIEMDEKFATTYNGTGRKLCGSRLTFAQFLRSTLGTYEPHWSPIHEICNPCKLKPTHILTMETFTPDSRVVLNQMGMDHFLDGFDQDLQINKELDTIVKYNFDRLFVVEQSKNEFQGCISHEELAFRLWNNFRWKGYIHPDFEYVIPKPGTNVKEDLRRQLVSAREAAIKDPEACKRFKNSFKVAAFKTIGKYFFEKFIKTYQVDFDLFGQDDKIEKMRAIY